MNETGQDPLSYWKRLALAMGMIGAVCGGLIAWKDPAGIGFAYRFAVLAWFVPAAGSLLFLLIHRSTGGQWAAAVQPCLIAGARLLPWTWLCFLPVLWLSPAARPPVRPEHTVLLSYVSFTGTAVRAVIFLGIFAGFAWLCCPTDPAQLRLRGDRFRGFGPVGLIVLAFSLHLLAVDWLMGLSPGWISTAFPLTWMAGLSVSGLALAVLVALARGADPSAEGAHKRQLGLDWGNLLLTGAVFWTYVGFMQFLIIWNGDIPRENVWYLQRGTPLWRAVLIALVFIHIVIPFFALLSRRVKRSVRALATVAALLFVAEFLYQAWMVLPAGPGGLASRGLALAAFAMGGAIFLHRYFARLAAPAAVP